MSATDSDLCRQGIPVDAGQIARSHEGWFCMGTRRGQALGSAAVGRADDQVRPAVDRDPAADDGGSATLLLSIIRGQLIVCTIRGGERFEYQPGLGRNRRKLEQIEQRKFDAEILANPGEELGAEKRISTHLEVVIVTADRDTEILLP
jgi:hypothetical protein